MAIRRRRTLAVLGIAFLLGVVGSPADDYLCKPFSGFTPWAPT